MKRSAVTALIVVWLTSMVVMAQRMAANPNTEAPGVKIARALSAAPANIAKGARVAERGKGNETVLREGNNGFTCFPGHSGVVGDMPYCANDAALQWINDFAERKPKPTNAEPGIVYMLAGGTDWSATDPFAKSGNPFKQPLHWMIMWPFDPVTTGLPMTAKQTGTWIMYAGTPWAHLMINQRP